MGILDKILSLAVRWLPLALSVAFIFVPPRSEDERLHMKWRLWLVVFALCFGLLAWWQQSRAIRAANQDRESAIKETSTRVSADVTKAVTQQYAGIVAEQQKKIEALQAQLTAQGKDVSVIKSSNIVTGKNPVRVEVTNPSNAKQTPLEVERTKLFVFPEASTDENGILIVSIFRSRIVTTTYGVDLWV